MRRRRGATPDRASSASNELRLGVLRDERLRAAPVRGLRPISELPLRARVLLLVAELAIVGFAAWVTVRLLQVDGRVAAILLIALSYVGAIVVGVAVATIIRMVYSLRAMPYLLGRGLRRLLTGRRGRERASE